MKYLSADISILTTNSTNNNDISLDENRKKCDMFGSFGIYVQITLAGLSFMILILKRFMEKPKRPWKIWFFDVSKQMVTASLAHFMNILLALFLALGNQTDECVWYFINLLIDTTLGLLICFMFMLVLDKIARCKNWKNLQSGLYFETEIVKGKKKTKLKVKMYFIQLGVWILVVFTSKCFLLIFQKVYSASLENIGNKLMSPFSNPKIKLIMVMVIIPFLCNAFQFWVVDNILKFNPSNTEEMELLKDGEVCLSKKDEKNNGNEYKLPDERNEMDFVVINFDKTNN